MSDQEQGAAASADNGDQDDDGPLDPQTERALNFVDMLLEKMDMDAEVTLAPDDGEGSADEIRLEIEGPDAGPAPPFTGMICTRRSGPSPWLSVRTSVISLRAM